MHAERLRTLLIHPPEDPEPVADPALTRRVMHRLAVRRRARRVTCLLGIAVLVLMTMALDAQVGSADLTPYLDRDLLVDCSALLLSAIVGVILVARSRPQPISHTPSRPDRIPA